MAKSRHQALVPESHSPPIGAYSPGVSVTMEAGDRLVFVSGQVAVDANGRTMFPTSPGEQARCVFERVDAVLASAGATKEDLVALTIYLTDIDDFDQISPVRDEWAPDPAPSSTLIEVSGLAVDDHHVEVSGIAVVSS